MGSHTPLTEHQRPVILFDGVCNLCNGTVQFIIRHDTRCRFSFASLQSAAALTLLGNHATTPGELYSVLLIKEGKVYERSDALLQISRELSGPWSAFYIFRFVPRFLRDGVYKLIANNRYKIFGRQESCMLPTAELRARFID